MSNLLGISAIFAVLSAIMFAAGRGASRLSGALKFILAIGALIACLWIALFGWAGSEMSIGEAASEKWFWLVAGFSPLIALICGFISGHQTA